MNLPEGGHQKQVMHSLDEQIYVRLYVESMAPKTVTLHQDIDWLNLEKHILLLQCVGLYRSNGKKILSIHSGRSVYSTSEENSQQTFQLSGLNNVSEHGVICYHFFLEMRQKLMTSRVRRSSYHYSCRK